MISANLMRQAAPSRLAALLWTPTGVMVLTTAGTFAVRMASSIIMTRLLSPDAFGLVGIVTSILFTISMLTDFGFQTYVARHARGDDQHFKDVIWTIHATRGVTLAIVAAAASPLIAAFMRQPALLWPLVVYSLTFVINGVTSLSLMTTLRHDGARKLSLFDFGLQVVQTIICIVLALWLRSVWSIIIAVVLQDTLRAILSFVLYPGSGHRIVRDKVLSEEFFAFSRVVLVSSALSLLLFQSDKLVLGRMLTLQEYGLYAIALNLASAPVSFVDSYIRRLNFPIFARTWRENPQAIRDVYYATGRRTALCYAFVLGGMIGCSGLIIAVLYDPRYQAAALFLPLLGLGSALRFLTFSAGELQTAIGHVSRTLHANIIRLVWFAVAAFFGYRLFGAIGIVGAVGLMEVPALLYNWIMLRRAGILNIVRELEYLAVGGIGAGIGFAVATGVLTLWPNI